MVNMDRTAVHFPRHEIEKLGRWHAELLAQYSNARFRRWKEELPIGEAAKDESYNQRVLDDICASCFLGQPDRQALWAAYSRRVEIPAVTANTLNANPEYFAQPKHMVRDNGHLILGGVMAVIKDTDRQHALHRLKAVGAPESKDGQCVEMPRMADILALKIQPLIALARTPDSEVADIVTRAMSPHIHKKLSAIGFKAARHEMRVKTGLAAWGFAPHEAFKMAIDIDSSLQGAAMAEGLTDYIVPVEKSAALREEQAVFNKVAAVEQQATVADARVAALEERMTKMEDRSTGLESKVDSLSSKMESGFGELKDLLLAGAGGGGGGGRRGGRGGKPAGPPCDHCGNSGHKIEACWTLHPELKPTWAHDRDAKRGGKTE